MNAWIIVQVWFFQHNSTIPCHVKPLRTVAISSCLTLHISCIRHHKNSKLPTFWFAGGWLDCVLSSVASPEGFTTLNSGEKPMGERIHRIERKVQQLKPKRSFSMKRSKTKQNIKCFCRNVASPTHYWQWKLATTTSYAYQKGPWSAISSTKKPWHIICLETTVCIHDIHWPCYVGVYINLQKYLICTSTQHITCKH